MGLRPHFMVAHCRLSAVIVDPRAFLAAHIEKFLKHSLSALRMSYSYITYVNIEEHVK